MHINVLAGFLISAGLAGQGIVPFGSPCGARATALAGYGSPVPGGTLEFHIGPAAPSALHVLLLGFSTSNWNGMPLPWLVPPSFGFAPGCALLVSVDVSSSIAVGPDGRGVLTVPLQPALAAMTFHLQAVGLPHGEPFYGTGGVSVTIANAATTTITGRARQLVSSQSVANARITAFAPALTSFFETRTDAAGLYSLSLSPGNWRLGCAASGFDYVEADIAVSASGAQRDFPLLPESQPGRWDVIGDTLPETFDATDIGVLLSDGRILYCHDTIDPILFDPRTGQKWLPAGSGMPQGCMNTTLLEDGRAFLVGGQDGIGPGNFQNATRQVKAWSMATGWTRLQDLLNTTGRWYPGLARLRDGRFLVMGGGTRPSAVRTNTCEVFDPVAGSWSWTGSMGQAVEFPPCGLLHTGSVLRTWGAPELYDPAAGTWSPTGAFVAPNRGWPGHSDHSMCVLHDGRALVIGISEGAGAAASMVERYDAVTAGWTARSSPDLKRMQCEVVPLPDGRVLVQGGDVQNRATAEPQLFGCVKRTDLYDADLDTWRRIADTLKFREYHAVTLLVPDGRVVTTGGTNIKFQNTPLSADIDAFSPPYLFRGVRPQVRNLSTTVPQRGAVVTFTVFPATRLSSVALMGTGATTHWVDGGVPRRLVLPVQQSGTSVTVALPTDPDLLPLGHYLWFAMVDDVPSEAVIVRVRP